MQIVQKCQLHKQQTENAMKIKENCITYQGQDLVILDQLDEIADKVFCLVTRPNGTYTWTLWIDKDDLEGLIK